MISPSYILQKLETIEIIQLILNTWIEHESRLKLYHTESCYNYIQVYNNYKKDDLDIINKKNLT